jgi:hypothetical protein
MLNELRGAQAAVPLDDARGAFSTAYLCGSSSGNG